MKILGAAIALNLTYFANMIIIDYWIKNLSDFDETYVKSDSRTYDDWGEYMQTGLFGAL